MKNDKKSYPRGRVSLSEHSEGLFRSPEGDNAGRVVDVPDTSTRGGVRIGNATVSGSEQAA